ncbi:MULTISPECIES: hypothetical protein [Streptosporangium]|uniref:Integral membrane protein n=1 Tax=Streptosporangium brasiliense TaxID=47480 RepID=A0ABT9QV03_9ACTN|nr:hypothetical protein [Streptosporangium brasiliense]MDP9860823.1 hypothetical protein [Streptosporangium brasiliense]
MLVLGVSWLILAPLCLWLLIRGNGATRLGSVVALAGLEVTTLWVHSTTRTPSTPAAHPPAMTAPAARPPAMTAPAAEPAGRATACAARLPSPEQARPARSQGDLRAVTFRWTAVADECDTATVVLRRDRRDVKVWLHEGPMRHRPAGARRLPVSVADGMASVEVRLAPPLPGKGAFRAIDGRTGRPISLS